MFSMFLPAIIKYEWNITDSKVEFLGSLFFIGSFCGYVLAGLFCDYFGRKMTLLIGNFLALFTFTLTSFVTDYW